MLRRADGGVALCCYPMLFILLTEGEIVEPFRASLLLSGSLFISSIVETVTDEDGQLICMAGTGFARHRTSSAHLKQQPTTTTHPSSLVYERFEQLVMDV